MNKKILFDFNDFNYIAIECGYTERLIEKNFDFTKFSEKYGYDNIEFIGNVNDEKTYPEKNKNILKYFCSGTLVFKKIQGKNINFGTIAGLIYDINNEYDFCNFMNCDNIYNINGYINEANLKVLGVYIDTESG